MLTSNPYAWNSNATVLYFDQPAGTGFSFANSSPCTNETQVSEDFYTALQEFFAGYPQYAQLDLYIFGESYGGKYVPAIVTRIFEGRNDPNPVNLKAFAIGDGWTDPIVQGDVSEYAYATGLIDENQRRELDKRWGRVLDHIHKGRWAQAADYFMNHTISWVATQAGNVSFYDVRSYAPFDYSDLIKYLNTPAVMNAINAISPWVLESGPVGSQLQVDFMQPITWALPTLLENYRALVYSGQFDLICNSLGTEKLYWNLEWSGQLAYQSAARKPWKVNGTMAGLARSAGNLTQLLVLGAGHMVPRDQPANSLAMLNRFLSDELF